MINLINNSNKPANFKAQRIDTQVKLEKLPSRSDHNDSSESFEIQDDDHSDLLQNSGHTKLKSSGLFISPVEDNRNSEEDKLDEFMHIIDEMKKLFKISESP